VRSPFFLSDLGGYNLSVTEVLLPLLLKPGVGRMKPLGPFSERGSLLVLFPFPLLSSFAGIEWKIGRAIVPYLLPSFPQEPL